MSERRHSPLHPAHEEHGAKFTDFSGWDMPVEYGGSGVLAEHAAVRDHIGIFDVSHLGAARITGPGAVDFVNSILTNDLHKIGPGKAQYTMLCTPTGGVVDDMIIYWFSDEELFVIPNAANCTEVCQILTEAAPDQVQVTNEHGEHAIIAVQGPGSEDLLRGLGLPTDHEYMSFESADFEGTAITVCRTGYTGEKGYELVTPAAAGLGIWRALLAADERVQPAGLGARDTLRTEMGYSLHGNDIGPDISPVQARLGFAIGWKKPSFRGHEALRAEKEAGPQRVAKGLKATGRGIPRPHMAVLDEAGEPLGEVTSGTFSPTLKQGIALALLDPGVELGTIVQVQIRKRVEPFEVVRPPFVNPGVKS